MHETAFPISSPEGICVIFSAIGDVVFGNKIKVAFSRFINRKVTFFFVIIEEAV